MIALILPVLVFGCVVVKWDWVWLGKEAGIRRGGEEWKYLYLTSPSKDHDSSTSTCGCEGRVMRGLSSGLSGRVTLFAEGRPKLQLTPRGKNGATASVTGVFRLCLPDVLPTKTSHQHPNCHAL